MPQLNGVCLFGLAPAPDGTAFRYKILALEAAKADAYELVLEATNVLTSYVAKFTLAELIAAVTEECSVEPAPHDMLAWLQQRFEDGEVEAEAAVAGGLQLKGVHQWDEYSIIIRLPPQGAMAPLADAHSTAWVAQEVLFSMGEQLRELRGRLEACEQRCPVSHQMEDLAAFMVASQGRAGAEGGDAASLRPAPARISLVRREQAEAEAEAPGSAAKATRRGDGLAGGASQQPTSPQLSGFSNQSRRTAEVGKPAEKRVAKPRAAGRGRANPLGVHRKR